MGGLEGISESSADYDIHWVASIDAELFDCLQEALRPNQRTVEDTIKTLKEHLPSYNLLAKKYIKPCLPLPPTPELIRVMQSAYWQNRRL